MKVQEWYDRIDQVSIQRVLSEELLRQMLSEAVARILVYNRANVESSTLVAFREGPHGISMSAVLGPDLLLMVDGSEVREVAEVVERIGCLVDPVCGAQASSVTGWKG